MRLRVRTSGTDRPGVASRHATARLSPTADLRAQPPGTAGPVPLFQ